MKDLMPTPSAPFRSRLLARAAALTAVVVASAGLAACGEKAEDETAISGTRDDVSLVLDWYPNANHSAIYAAQASGAFERAGLNVTIRPPADPAGTLKLLETDKADFVVSYEPEVLLARDKGAKVQSVGALVQVPLTSLVSLDAKITKPSQLKGTTVGTAGIPYQAAYLDSILREGGVDPESVKRADLGFNLSQPLIGGKVDASLGMFWNYEALELENKKRKPTVLRLEEIGVPTYNELVLTASEDTVKSRGPVVRRFVQAITLGAKSLEDQRSVGLDAVMAAGDGLDRRLQEESLTATLPYIFPENDDRPFGWQDPTEWTAYANWMQENGLINNARVVARAYTNEYLAGEGVGDDAGS